VFFYSNEHEPIHVHGRHNGCERKAEFNIVNGKIQEIVLKSVKGYKPLSGVKLNGFKLFLEVYGNKIVEKWIDYFVCHKNIEFEKINTRIG
jgi:hypothetical protein